MICLLMKTILRIAVSILLTYALLNLAGCNAPTNKGTEAAEVRDEFEEERTEASEDLRELREEKIGRAHV